MKNVLAAGLFMSVAAMASPASAATYFGYTANPASAVNGPAKAANTDFLAALTRYSVEDFESIALNTAAPLALTFEGSFGPVAASYTGDGSIRSKYNGAYPTSGTHDILTFGSGTLNFATPTTAFGLYVTDASDFRNPLFLDVITGTGTLTTYVVSDGTQAPNGSLRFFGLTSAEAISSITFRGPGRWDSFGYDDMIVGTAAVPEPSTWAMMILGVGAVGGALRGRKRALLTA